MVQLGDGDDWLGGSALLLQANCEERACEAECYNKPFDGKTEHLPLVTFAVLVALIVFPLCIPNSWTSEYLHLKRFQIQN